MNTHHPLHHAGTIDYPIVITLSDYLEQIINTALRKNHTINLSYLTQPQMDEGEPTGETLPIIRLIVNDDKTSTIYEQYYNSDNGIDSEFLSTILLLLDLHRTNTEIDLGTFITQYTEHILFE